MSQIPNSWTTVEIEHVLLQLANGNVLQQGWSPQCHADPAIKDDEWGVLKTTAIQEGLFLPEHNKRLPDDLNPRPQIEVVPGDILMTCAGPRNRCGVTCLVKTTRKRLLMSGKMYRFRNNPQILNSGYLEAFLLSQTAKHAINEMKTGINDSGLNLTHDRFKKLRMPVAPVNEQNRIVAKIEELFSELDKGIENLKTARAQLKVYRQALLKHAFEGKLTAQWRAKHQGKLETAEALLKRIQQERAQRHLQQLADWEASGKQGSKPKAPKPQPPLTAEELAELPELPEGWGWVRLGELTSIIAGNAFEKAEYSDTGIRLFQIANVSFGEILWDKVVHLPEKYWDDYPELRLFAGDLVMALNRPLLGDDLKIGRLGLADTPSILYQRVGKFVSHNEDVSNLIYWYLRSSYFISSLKKELRGVNIPFINQTRLMEYPVPLCDFDELAQIVVGLESSLSIADQLELTITTSLQQAEALRQSILKKAFSGQLVPQDPHDEPASALLARIKAERAVDAKNAHAAAKPRKMAGRK